MEKEFKSDRTHQDKVTGIVRMQNETEFLTASLDSSLKLWDKHLQGTGYTFETHEPLHSMTVSGEKKNLLVAGLGRGNFIVYGLETKNQLDIFELAHAEEIS
jgi:WD40 repeat protein